MDSRKQINGHGQADDVDYEHPFGGAKADFTARKFDWLKGVSFDPELGPFDFEVAFWIMQHVNEAKGVAWPSDNLIAGLVGGSARHVQRARQRLEERGWLEWENTFGESNTYKPKYDRVSGMLDAITVFRDTSDSGVRPTSDSGVRLTPYRNTLVGLTIRRKSQGRLRGEGK
jgi:hypothetical protein